MNLAFMGTPDFSVPFLEFLIEGEFNLRAIITQPDKPRGRNKKIQSSSVKKIVTGSKIPLFQPDNVNSIESINYLKSLDLDLIVVVAYGQILKEELLQIPKFGCINIHGSLLPKYRGAAPIQWSLINGEIETGTTSILMNPKMDAGDIICQDSIKIEEFDNYISLHDKLAKLGVKTLEKSIKKIQDHDFFPLKQNEEEVTYAPMLNKEDGLIKWNNNALSIHNLVRGVNPWPGAFTFYKNNRIKILKTEIFSVEDTKYSPGEVVSIKKNEGLTISCGRGQVLVLEIQPSGKKSMNAYQFALGSDLERGFILK